MSLVMTEAAPPLVRPPGKESQDLGPHLPNGKSPIGPGMR